MRSRRSSGVGGVAEWWLFTNVFPFRENYSASRSLRLTAFLFPGIKLFRIVFTLSRASPFAYLSSSPIDKNFCHGHGHTRRVSACSVCASGSLLREAVASAVCGSSRALPSSCLASTSSAAWRCLQCNVRSMPALAWSCWTEQVPSAGAHSLAWCAGTRQHFPSVP